MFISRVSEVAVSDEGWERLESKLFTPQGNETSVLCFSEYVCEL